MSARLLKFQSYPFSCCVFEERRQPDKKKKSVVAGVHLSHVLRLAFPLTQKATVYQAHLRVCLEMGRFGINPGAAQLCRALLCVRFPFFEVQFEKELTTDDAEDF